MDTIESWYSETGGLSYDEPKANTWHPLVSICHKWGSYHHLTAAVHKWTYKSETLSLWPCQAYGSGCSCPPSPTSLSHVTTGLRIVWHLEETTRSSAKMLGGAGYHKHRVLSIWCLVLRRIGQLWGHYDPSTVNRREREREIWDILKSTGNPKMSEQPQRKLRNDATITLRYQRINE